MNNSSSSVSDNDKFRQFCKQASENDSVFNSFRRSQEFQQIMEHVSVDVAKKCIKLIDKPFLLKRINKFRTNDEVGFPHVENFEEPFCQMAPTTIRYIKILNDIYSMFGRLGGKNIVEIGTGYGGQAKIICDAFKIKSFTAIDLPEPLAVMKKYMASFDIDNIEYIEFNKLTEKKYDLVISNYAFSECSRDIQDIYFDKVLSKSEHGYMICNFISDKFGINSYNLDQLKNKFKQSDISLTIEQENPSTFAGNVLLIW